MRKVKLGEKVSRDASRRTEYFGICYTNGVRLQKVVTSYEDETLFSSIEEAMDAVLKSRYVEYDLVGAYSNDVGDEVGVYAMQLGGNAWGLEVRTEASVYGDPDLYDDLKMAREWAKRKFGGRKNYKIWKPLWMERMKDLLDSRKEN